MTGWATTDTRTHPHEQPLVFLHLLRDSRFCSNQSSVGSKGMHTHSGRSHWTTSAQENSASGAGEQSSKERTGCHVQWWSGSGTQSHACADICVKAYRRWTRARAMRTKMAIIGTTRQKRIHRECWLLLRGGIPFSRFLSTATLISNPLISCPGVCRTKLSTYKFSCSHPSRTATAASSSRRGMATHQADTGWFHI